MLTLLLTILGGFVLILSIEWVERTKWVTCRCGRERRPWFAYQHPKVWWMVCWVAFAVYITVDNVIYRHRASAVLWAIVSVYYIFKIIRHEQGRHRNILRQLGRVVLNQHGRLEVQS